MKDLLIEYRATKRDTLALLTKLENARDLIVIPDGIRDRTNVVNAKEIRELQLIEEDIETVKKWLSNLNFAIERFNKGFTPGHRRGIERRSSLQKEVKVDMNSVFFQTLDKYSHNEKSIKELENEAFKKELARSIVKSLTARQKDILELYANGYTETDIARILETSQQYISKTLIVCKQKIIAEGWVML
ncbi:LuxR C-terminal-related transcriptional regulator [Psychrobacillus sp.]|uniref:LuxR C-terminal-related transcriptional regulator n=1 Tax=Psychrobacillus sp. TaxID=1871623 RepID=UPI0028BE5D3D|nr:hypothetical protein [Psychrobacillus sp.]